MWRNRRNALKIRYCLPALGATPNTEGNITPLENALKYPSRSYYTIPAMKKEAIILTQTQHSSKILIKSVKRSQHKTCKSVTYGVSIGLLPRCQIMSIIGVLALGRYAALSPSLPYRLNGNAAHQRQEDEFT